MRVAAGAMGTSAWRVRPRRRIANAAAMVVQPTLLCGAAMLRCCDVMLLCDADASQRTWREPG